MKPRNGVSSRRHRRVRSGLTRGIRRYRRGVRTRRNRFKEPPRSISRAASGDMAAALCPRGAQCVRATSTRLFVIAELSVRLFVALTSLRRALHTHHTLPIRPTRGVLGPAGWHPTCAGRDNRNNPRRSAQAGCARAAEHENAFNHHPLIRSTKLSVFLREYGQCNRVEARKP